MREPQGDHWGVVPYESDCATCNDDTTVVYGGEELPCPACRPNAYDEAVSTAAFPRERNS